MQYMSPHQNIGGMNECHAACRQITTLVACIDSMQRVITMALRHIMPVLQCCASRQAVQADFALQNCREPGVQTQYVCWVCYVIAEFGCCLLPLGHCCCLALPRQAASKCTEQTSLQPEGYGNVLRL